MGYRASTPKERGRVLSRIIVTLGALLWLNGLFLSLTALWNGPLMAGVISLFALAAATLDAGKRTLGSYGKIFTPDFKRLPINQKAMWLGVVTSIIVNAYAIYQYFQ